MSVCVGCFEYFFSLFYLCKIYICVFLHLPGCKIKALRAKTNTYIKTPVRGEEPVFIVTGRREDVEMAKREIVSAAEHFSMIRASRCKAGGPGGGSALPGPPHLPGQTTIQVYWDCCGLVDSVFRCSVCLQRPCLAAKESLSFSFIIVCINLQSLSISLITDPGEGALQSSWVSCWTKGSNYQAHPAADSHLHCDTQSRERPGV